MANFKGLLRKRLFLCINAVCIIYCISVDCEYDRLWISPLRKIFLIDNELFTNKNQAKLNLVYSL